MSSYLKIQVECFYFLFRLCTSETSSFIEVIDRKGVGHSKKKILNWMVEGRKEGRQTYLIYDPHMIYFKCLRVSMHKQNLYTHSYCYIHILLRRFYININKYTYAVICINACSFKKLQTLIHNCISRINWINMSCSYCFVYNTILHVNLY